ncbi:hypothetical protein, partial [uncultured Rhodoblastus sp.]|uniref:hypothetical protein n=1 Tax=uncultured Rhodoblastus sp. TaxID=543037 RepID=UPI0025E28BBD
RGRRLSWPPPDKTEPGGGRLSGGGCGRPVAASTLEDETSAFGSKFGGKPVTATLANVAVADGVGTER